MKQYYGDPNGQRKECLQTCREFLGSRCVQHPGRVKELCSGNEQSRSYKLELCEMSSIESNGTWQLKDLPSGRKAVGSKWVYKIKRNTDEKVGRFRARLVTQGYRQQYGTDYDQVFAPVAVRQTTSRIPLAVAAKQGITVRQFDVKTAVLY